MLRLTKVPTTTPTVGDENYRLVSRVPRLESQRVYLEKREELYRIGLNAISFFFTSLAFRGNFSCSETRRHSLEDLRKVTAIRLF